MEKKTVTGTMLTLLLIIAMTLAFNVQPVKSDWTWTETIYIRADGSIDPDTAPISTADYVTYILTDSITGDVPEDYSAIVVEKDSIVIDGAGYSVQGTGSGTGIDLGFRHNVTLKNVKVTSFKGYGGIRLFNSDNNTIAGNSVSDMIYPGQGIHLISSSNNTIINNNAYSSINSAGIRLYNSFDNKIARNTLTDNGGGIALDSSNNNTLSGNNAYLNNGGISIYYSFNNTIYDNAVYLNSGSGIALESSSNNTLANNKAYLNNGYGIHLWGCSNNVLIGNNASGNSGSGVFLISSIGDNLTDNIASSNSEYGISLIVCREYVLSGNTVSDNLFNFDVYGSDFSEFNHYIDTSNTVDGKPIYYLIGASDAIYGTEINAGTIYLINCNNITIRDLDLTENGDAVFFFNTADSTIRNITASNNECGVHLCSSNNNTIDGNRVYLNEDDGIYLESSNNNTVSDNNASSSSHGAGIRLYQSSDNTISGNIMTSNVDGINFYQSNNNLITGNIVSNNRGNGIYLGEPRNNVLFHNNFINNAIQAYAIYPGYINTWDNGYPSGGNYWSDYGGTDQYGGSGQDQLGSDGMGDTPYVIDADNRDRYPLMNPWTPLEHELIASIMTPASITIGRSSLLNATVMNLGLNDEVDAELQLLINGTVVDSTAIAFLKARNSYTLSYIWTPTVEGTYNVTAYVPPLPEEVNKENNRATEFVAAYVPQPPVASFTYSPTAPIAGKTVTFNASVSYDPDGSIVSYDWEFGDGTTGSGKVVTHAYANPGAYTASLTVTDNEDQTDTEASLITISEAPKVGVKAGDWIKIDYTISGASSGSLLPQWLKVEFLSIEGTSATVRVTMHMSDGTEQEETLAVDVVAGGQALGLSGFLIPANCTTGDCVYMTGYGNITIEGETTRTYAGASRTVVYASFSQLGTQLTYYWDKQTGVMVEASTTSGSVSGTGKTTETNLWSTLPESVEDGIPFWTQWWFYALAAAIVIVLAAGIYFARKRKTPTSTAPSVAAEGT